MPSLPLPPQHEAFDLTLLVLALLTNIVEDADTFVPAVAFAGAPAAIAPAPLGLPN